MSQNQKKKKKIPHKMRYAFGIEPVANEGMTLWQVVFYELQGARVAKKHVLSEPDMKDRSLQRIQKDSYYLYFEDRLPKGVTPRA